ncbi:helix-turn-helix domain-containing protein [Halapricum desulfuricans]|uniref:Putative transcriptional regulator n=1 Tax=Halapricum desulfuricans TaxID=2841257 RepID=A0A897NB10_9EURY|nr:helix-turn-helix domain-containing protein [Halapricum desulfuricans]QSG08283.1 putative transcriptional regulator [Halapricum desulfuricans]
MSPDDTTDEDRTDVAGGGESIDVEAEDGGEPVGVTVDDEGGVRERLEEEADRAVGEFDDRLVDLLAWVLDTETRARIYVNLRQYPHSTSDEIAEETGLYPSTVREALAELHEEGKVTRRKRESDGAGNNPYEYSAMAPSDLVSEIVDDVQEQLNTVFNLDSHLEERELDADEPVTITVEDASENDEE